MQFIITNDGIASISSAMASGTPIHVDTFKVGSSVNYSPLQTDLALRGTTHYTGSVLDYRVVGTDTIEYLLLLGPNIGPFSFGEIGLYLNNGKLFALGSLSNLQYKSATVSNTPGVSIEIVASITYTNISSIVAYYLQVNAYSKLVEYATLALLPPTPIAASNGCIIRNTDDNGEPILAIKVNESKWRFSNFSRVELAEPVAGTSDYLSIQTSMSNAPDNFRRNRYIIQFVSGVLTGKSRLITSWNNFLITWDESLPSIPSPGDLYEIYSSDFASQHRHYKPTASSSFSPVTFVDSKIWLNKDDLGGWRKHKGGLYQSQARTTGRSYGNFATATLAVAAGVQLLDYYYNTTSNQWEEVTNLLVPASVATVRAGTRQIPQEAVVTAEAGRAVIWDTTGQIPAMWAVSPLTFGVITSVDASNELVVVGTTLNGVFIYSFKAQCWTNYLSTGMVQYSPSTFTALGTALPIDATRSISSNVVNDVVAWTRQDSKLTGRGVYEVTVALATNSGVSVVWSDGTTTKSSVTTAFTSISLDANESLYAVSGVALNQDVYSFNSYSYTVTNFATSSVIYGRTSTGATYPYMLPTTTRVEGTRLNRFAAISANAGGGITLVDYNINSPRDSMTCLITNLYNTGWMVGNTMCSFTGNAASSVTDKSGAGLVLTGGTIVTAVVATGSDLYSFNTSILAGATLPTTAANGHVAWWQEVAGAWVHYVSIVNTVSGSFSNGYINGNPSSIVPIADVYISAGTTLNIRAGKTVTMVKASVGSITAKQAADMYADESQRFVPNAVSLLSTATVALDLYYDKYSDYLAVANGSVADYLTGICRNSSYTMAATVQSVASSNGMDIIASTGASRLELTRRDFLTDPTINLADGLVPQATYMRQPVNLHQAFNQSYNFAEATGSSDSMVIVLDPLPHRLVDGVVLRVRTGAGFTANTVTAPTVTLQGVVIPIKKSGGIALSAGDMRGAGYTMLLTYNQAGNYLELTNAGDYVRRSGDTMLGPLIQAADPLVPLGTATKQYVDNIVLGLFDDRGSYNAATTNGYPTTGGSGGAGGSGVGALGAVMKGDIWNISSDSFITSSDVVTTNVYINDTIRALVDNPGQLSTNWDIMVSTAAVSTNTAGSIVRRDASGNFSAGVITASLTGVASHATNLNNGVLGNIAYQSGVSTTSFLAPGTLNQVLTCGGAAAPTWGPGTISGVQLGGTLKLLTFGNHMASGSANYDGSTIATLSTDATNINAPSTIVARDASGNFSAGTITADLTGTALNATNAVNLIGGTALCTSLTVGNGANESLITMIDLNEQSRRIYCNTGLVGFLKAVGVQGTPSTWGAYCDNTGNWTAAGDITGLSDARLKTNVETLTGSLGRVLSMRGVAFDKDGVRGIGVIAQEMQKVQPLVVHTGQDELATLSVAYGNIVAELIEAVKELKAEIDELKSKSV